MSGRKDDQQPPLSVLEQAAGVDGYHVVSMAGPLLGISNRSSSDHLARVDPTHDSESVTLAHGDVGHSFLQYRGEVSPDETQPIP